MWDATPGVCSALAQPRDSLRYASLTLSLCQSLCLLIIIRTLPRYSTAAEGCLKCGSIAQSTCVVETPRMWEAWSAHVGPPHAMRLKIAADGERFVTEHLVDGEARYAVGRATVVDSDQSSQRGGTFLLRASGSSGRRRLRAVGWLFTVLRRAFKSLTFARGGTEEYCRYYL